MSKVFKLSEVAELAEKYADYLKAPCDGGGFVKLGFVDWYAAASDPDAHREPSADMAIAVGERHQTLGNKRGEWVMVNEVEDGIITVEYNTGAQVRLTVAEFRYRFEPMPPATASCASPAPGALAPNPGAVEPKPEGGPAFPFSLHPEYRYGDVESVSAGMTLRDYFAGQALSASAGRDNVQRTAEYCYEYADAMIAEREKRR